MNNPAVILFGVTVVAIVVLALYGRVPQNAAYHQFADQRSVLGIPNFWNVVSNCAFLVVGLAGLLAIANSDAELRWSQYAHFAFFLSLILLGFGSAYYHLAPDNGRLTWDRLPMATGFMSFLTIVIGERIDSGIAALLLPYLLLSGAASVAYWHVSERRGQGDLRPYILVQFLPLVLVALITLLFPAPLATNVPIWGLLAAYAVAKLVESFDERIFRMNRVISGHTLKHLLAAGGVYFVVRALLRGEG